MTYVPHCKQSLPCVALAEAPGGATLPALIGLSEEWMFRGVLFQGLRSRLAMWPRDFGTFVNSATSPKSGGPVDFSQGWTWALPILIVLPNFLYALFLLRRVRKDTQLSTD